MTKLLQKAMAEASRLPEAEQDRLGRDLLAEIERLHTLPRIADKPGRPMTAEELDELARFRNTIPRASIDAGTFVSNMRDEWER
jgi:hypothetical protein